MRSARWWRPSWSQRPQVRAKARWENESNAEIRSEEPVLCDHALSGNRRGRRDDGGSDAGGFVPADKIPVVVVATFYSGMPPEQVEADITDTFERFFTLGSNIDHIESRSLTGVSLIKIYFEPGTDPNAALSNIANLAMADLRRLPPGTLPPVVLKFDASSLPVCLVTLKGEGLDETRLKDLAQFQ